MAHALPWYREAIPKFIMEFEEKMKNEGAKGLTWLPWTKYAKIAQRYIFPKIVFLFFVYNLTSADFLRFPAALKMTHPCR